MRPCCIYKLNKMPVHLRRLHLSWDAQKLKRKPDQLLETPPCQVHSALLMATVRSLLQRDCISNKIVYHSAGGRKWFPFPFSNEIKGTARTLGFNYMQLPYQFPFSSLVKHPQITHKSLWPVSDQGNWWVSDILLRSHHFMLESSLQVWRLSFYLPSTTCEVLPTVFMEKSTSISRMRFSAEVTPAWKNLSGQQRAELRQQFVFSDLIAEP